MDAFYPSSLVSIAATFVNPYGMDLLPFLLRMVSIQRPEVSEWHPLPLVSLVGLLYLMILIVSLYWLALSTKPRRPILLILLGITALLPWVSVRHLPLFYIAAIVLISEHAGSTWERTHPLKKPGRPFSHWLVGLSITIAAVFFIMAFTQHPDQIHVEGDYPIAAVTLINQSGVSGNLATQLGWGGYILWHLGPQIKVSIDGRERYIYSTSIYQQNLNFTYGVNNWDALLKQHRTDMALIRKGDPAYNLLKLTPDWSMVYEDSSSALFVNKASSLVEPLLQAVVGFAPLPANGYFP
jgi:hypothetical protein